MRALFDRRRRPPRGPLVRGRALLDPARVGPKFSRQAEMAAAGLPVPRFFCVAAEVFREVTEPHRADIRRVLCALRDTDADAAGLAAAAEELRALVTGIPLPAGLGRRITAAFDAEFGPEAVVSVRSSTVALRAGEGEDSARDAFAGMSDSFLYVGREGVLDAVRACWASAFGAEALAYHRARGTDPAEVAVAVGVQRMVFGRRSFVLFTCDPTTGARDPVLAAGLGIGEGVVQERVPVDHWFTDRATGEVTARTTRKHLRMEQDPDRPGAGPVLLPVAGEEADRPALTDEQVHRITALGHRVEELFGAPQDIEGTVTGDGAVHLLQSRPVVLERQRQRLWSNANITESYPGTTTALTYSYARQFYREIFTDFYRRVGIPESAIDRHRSDLDGMIGLLHGSVYYSLSAWYRLHRLSPLFPLWRPHWERMMGLARSSPDSRPDRLGLRPGQLPGLAVAAARFLVLAARHDRHVADFDAWWERTAAPAREELRAADPLGRVDRLATLWREAGAHWGVTLVNDLLLTLTAGATTALFARWLPDEPDGLESDLLCGDEENRSATILMSLVHLAEHARTRPELLREMERDPAEQVWARIADGRHGEDTARLFDDHVRAHGDRGLHELKLEVPNPRQRPEQLLRAVAGHARAGVTVRGLRAQEGATRERAEARLRAALAGRPLRRAALTALLARQRRLVAYRENSRYSRGELFGLAKQAYASLGEELARRGVLASAGDVVHLTQEEVAGHFDGTGVTADLRVLADLRRAEHEAEHAELPMHFATVGPVGDALPVAGPAATGGGLAGLGSSGGVVRGTARLVLDPLQPVEPTEDMILIARETDPGWIFLMLGARGIVVERGTMLSHTAITGRKFGIPTIVSLPHATRRIPDGARIEMNGATGEVTVLDPPEGPAPGVGAGAAAAGSATDRGVAGPAAARTEGGIR